LDLLKRGRGARDTEHFDFVPRQVAGLSFLGMAVYHAPEVICGFLVWCGVAWVGGGGVVGRGDDPGPGYMTHYCHALDASEIFNPLKALRRVREGGRKYWHAWGIALAALGCSFLGLLGFGVGFLVTSVWFWQVAGFGFATVFSGKFGWVERSEGLVCD